MSSVKTPAQLDRFSMPEYAPIKFDSVTGGAGVLAAVTMATISRDRGVSSRMASIQSFSLAKEMMDLKYDQAENIMQQATKDFAGAMLGGTINCVGSAALGYFSYKKMGLGKTKGDMNSPKDSSGPGSTSEECGSPGLGGGQRSSQSTDRTGRAGAESRRNQAAADAAVSDGENALAAGASGHLQPAGGGSPSRPAQAASGDEVPNTANPPAAGAAGRSGNGDAGEEFNKGQAWIMIGQSTLQAVEAAGNMGQQSCVFAGKFDEAQRKEQEGREAVLEAVRGQFDKMAERSDQAAEKGLEVAQGLFQNEPRINFA